MKKLTVLVACALSAAFIFAGCSSAPNTNDESGAPSLKIYATIFPVYDFARNIAGDKAEVSMMISSSAEPHDWEPTTRDIVNLESADIFIYSGAGMEHWVERVMASVKNEELAVVNASANISLLAEAQKDSGANHNESGFDPHVWLSIENAKTQVSAIAEALILCDSQNAAYYNNNLNTYLAKLDSLLEEYHEALDQYKGSSIVVSHMAYAYLCGEFGLNQVSARGVSAEEEPPPSNLTKVIDYIKENNINIVFAEDSADSKLMQAISAETGAGIDVLYTIEKLPSGSGNDEDDYISLMRFNLESLKKAFAY